MFDEKRFLKRSKLNKFAFKGLDEECKSHDKRTLFHGFIFQQKMIKTYVILSFVLTSPVFNQ